MAAKFSVGDIIKNTGTGKNAVVRGKSYNSIKQEDEYYLEWEDRKGTQVCVKSENADLACEFIGRELPSSSRKEEIDKKLDTYMYSMHFMGPDGIIVPPLNSDKKVCDHTWKIYQGFTDNFEYCEKCDQRK